MVGGKDDLGNLSPLILRTCPSHLKLTLIMALESGIESHFSGAYCLKSGQSDGYPKESDDNSFGKHLIYNTRIGSLLELVYQLNQTLAHNL